MVERAAELFNQVSDGPLPRAALDGERTDCVRASPGIRSDLVDLSTGPFSSCTCASGCPRRRSSPGEDEVPLVMDDVLVNFDPDRAEAASQLASSPRWRSIIRLSSSPAIQTPRSDGRCFPEARIVELDRFPR